MPCYTYRCSKCDKEFEAFHMMGEQLEICSQEDTTECEQSQAEEPCDGKLIRLLSPVFKKKEIENIFKKINPIINDYMEENSVNLLFDSKNIFMGAKKLNLTEDILKKINNELK